MRLATRDEIANWDKLLQKNPDGGDILQSKTMARTKETTGWKSEFWVYETSFGNVYATTLSQKFFGLGKLAYLVRGPGVVNAEQLREITEQNQKLKGFFATKMEPAIPWGAKLNDLKKVKDIQANSSTVMIDLTPSEDQIFASFRQRARREIRAADKDDIEIKKVPLTDETIDQMFKLYSDTGKRAPFFVRPRIYHETFWRYFHSAGEGDLYFAYAPNEKMPIAGAFICKMGKKALYKDGGSERTAHKHFAHKLQWEIMRDLKGQGIREYDLHGVPPHDRLHDPTHPHAGLAMFKLSFNEEITEYVGAYDQILNSRKYALWVKYGQRIYQSLAYRLHKTTLY